MADDHDNREPPAQPASSAADSRVVDIDVTQTIGEQAGGQAVGLSVEHLTAKEVHVHNPQAQPPSFRNVALTGVLAFLGAVLINYATSLPLPESWKPYLWLSWPLAVLLTVASIVVAYRQGRSFGGTTFRINFSKLSLSLVVLSIVLIYALFRYRHVVDRPSGNKNPPIESSNSQANTTKIPVPIPARIGPQMVRLVHIWDQEFQLHESPGFITPLLSLKLHERDVITKLNEDFIDQSDHHWKLVSAGDLHGWVLIDNLEDVDEHFAGSVTVEAPTNLAKIINLEGASGKIHELPEESSATLHLNLDEGTLVQKYNMQRNDQDGNLWCLIAIGNVHGWMQAKNLG